MSNTPVSGSELILDLVNHHNQGPVPFTLDNIRPVGQIPVPGAGNQHKGQTTLAAMPFSEYEGEVQITYDRINLSTIFQGITPSINGLGATSIHKMLPELNRELGLLLTEDDVEDSKYTWLEERERRNVLLKAKKSSLIYSGELNVVYERRRMTLAEALRGYQPEVHLLPGNTLEGIAENKVSVTKDTWATDFTPYYNVIRKHEHFEIFANSSGVRNLMASMFGFANWPTGWDNKVIDMPTSSIAEANQDYDRVVVHYLFDNTYNKSRPYEGIAYFHYNEL